VRLLRALSGTLFPLLIKETGGRRRDAIIPRLIIIFHATAFPLDMLSTRVGQPFN